MKYIFIISVIIIFLSCLFIIFLAATSKENFDIKRLEFPFKNVFNEKGEIMNIIALTAPFRTHEHKKIFQSYKKKSIPIIGVTSYLNFPGPINNKFEDNYHIKHPFNYIDSCIGWLYCFRELQSRGLSNVPKIKMSESDLYDPTLFTPNETKEYDFIYVCLNDNKDCAPGWQSSIRNWELFKKCLPILCEKFKLTGLIIGRQNCDYTPKCKNSLKVIDFLPYHKFINLMSKCKFLIVPNITDPSPRIIAEALCLNIPILVNKHIYGGWHYVNEKTGEFFTDEHDFDIQLQKLLSNLSKYQPRKFYQENYGIINSGVKLKEFIKELYPELKKCKYLTIK
jgi:hypothetical protein